VTADLRGRIDRIADRLTPPDRTSDPVRFIIDGLEAGDLDGGIIRYAEAVGRTPEDVVTSLEALLDLVDGDRP
jgi:hypothetical protein